MAKLSRAIFPNTSDDNDPPPLDGRIYLLLELDVRGKILPLNIFGRYACTYERGISNRQGCVKGKGLYFLTETDRHAFAKQHQRFEQPLKYRLWGRVNNNDKFFFCWIGGKNRQDLSGVLFLLSS